jgi:hypothetical protein
MDKIRECNSLDYCPKIDSKTRTNCYKRSAKEMLQKFEKKASNQWGGGAASETRLDPPLRSTQNFTSYRMVYFILRYNRLVKSYSA